jgi:Ribonuclease G/E
MRPALVTIHAAWSPGEVRVAAMADGVLIDYAPWRPGSPDGVGDVYRGRVTAIAPGMAGAFVALASGVQDGFLPDSEGAKGLTEGENVAVRIVRAAQGGKGPRLSARVEGAEDGPMGLRRRGADPFRDLASRYPEARIIVDDPALLATSRPDLGDRIALVPDAFDDGIETAVECLAASVVMLASGVVFSIHPTPALVAIDVDAGGALAGREGTARRHLALNTAALPELARQIRLRNLSGAILIDLAGMKVKQRVALGPALAAALAGDPVRPRFLGFTALGLAEIVRPRVRAPLHEALSGAHAAGLAALRVIARSTRVEPGRRLMLRAAPAVIAALEADVVAMADLARITGQRLNSRSDPSLTGNGWRLEDIDG